MNIILDCKDSEKNRSQWLSQMSYIVNMLISRFKAVSIPKTDQQSGVLYTFIQNLYMLVMDIYRKSLHNIH